MAFIISNIVSRNCIKTLEETLVSLTICSTNSQIRERHTLNPKPKLRHPTWLTKKNRVIHDDYVTQENQEFVKEVVQDKYGDTPLNKEIFTNAGEWSPSVTRTGVIARKIGIYPMWLKDGTKMLTSLLQVLDNHVIKYYAPEQYDPPRKLHRQVKNRKGCLLIGAEGADPSLLTKEYCGIFKESGVIPKKILARFFVSPESVLLPGTPLNVLHYQVGNVIDVRGQTIDRGFQGVMKRHGFKGMPASHGVTKTHRRGGNIGGGGEKGRVWPGTKMPGHMGNQYRIIRGLEILRINTKHNILWVAGQGIPGNTNSIVTLYDTVLPLRKPKEALPFPTYFPKDDENLPEDIFGDKIHKFSDDTILYNES